MVKSRSCPAWETVASWHTAGLATVCATVLLLMGSAQAQTIFRGVEADGRTVFADKPPTGSTKVTVVVLGNKTAEATGATLPFELRQVASKYPVTLYGASNCAPCGLGRALLSARGIPFTEKTVQTAEDVQALQRISGENSLPFLSVGVQQIKGYSEAEWVQFLNAAGYPQTSALPSGYRNPAATPLAALQKPAPAAPAEDRSPPLPALSSPPSAQNASNPAGIIF